MVTDEDVVRKIESKNPYTITSDSFKNFCALEKIANQRDCEKRLVSTLIDRASNKIGTTKVGSSTIKGIPILDTSSKICVLRDIDMKMARKDDGSRIITPKMSITCWNIEDGVVTGSVTKPRTKTMIENGVVETKKIIDPIIDAIVPSSLHAPSKQVVEIDKPSKPKEPTRTVKKGTVSKTVTIPVTDLWDFCAKKEDVSGTSFTFDDCVKEFKVDMNSIINDSIASSNYVLEQGDVQVIPLVKKGDTECFATGFVMDKPTVYASKGMSANVNIEGTCLANAEITTKDSVSSYRGAVVDELEMVTPENLIQVYEDFGIKKFFGVLDIRTILKDRDLNSFDKFKDALQGESCPTHPSCDTKSPVDCCNDELYFENDLILQIYASLRMSKPMLFSGPPGTGKTELGKKLARLLYGTDGVKDHFRRVQVFPGIEYYHLYGDWNYAKQFSELQRCRNEAGGVTKECDLNVMSRKFWDGGPALDMLENGGLLLFDEYNRGQPSFQATNLELFEEKQATIPSLGTKRTWKPLVMIATRNQKPTGTDVFKLSDAFLRRVSNIIFNPVGKPLMKNILLSRIPDIDTRTVKLVCKIMDGMKGKEFHHQISSAELKDFAFQLDELIRPKIKGGLGMGLSDKTVLNIALNTMVKDAESGFEAEEAETDKALIEKIVQNICDSNSALCDVTDKQPIDTKGANVEDIIVKECT